MPNFLQYINRNNNLGTLDYLISGADVTVRKKVAEAVLKSAYSRGVPLLVLDNTDWFGTDTDEFCQYKLYNILHNGIDMSYIFNDICSFTEVFSSFSIIETGKLLEMLDFIQITEELLCGKKTQLSLAYIQAYTSPVLVERKINQLLSEKKIDISNKEHLFGLYSEMAPVLADLKYRLVLAAPFFKTENSLTADKAPYLNLRRFGDNDDIKKICAKLFSVFCQQYKTPIVLILDDGSGTATEAITSFVKSTDGHICLISEDIFTFGEKNVSYLTNKFALKIYSRHRDMSSCLAIEDLCGTIEVPKRSFTTTIDYRLRNNTALDMLLCRNKTSSETVDVSGRESVYRKEMIAKLLPATAIVDFGTGEKSILSF